MALVVADRVKETTTTTGTGAITLGGAEVNFVTFSSALSDGDTTYYAIVDDSNQDFEVGLGTYASSGNTLTRTTVLASSNSGSAVNLSAGSKEVFISYPAGKSVYLDGSGQLVIGGTAVTATAAELNYVDGVTSSIQTQIDSISPTLTATASGALANGDTVIVNSNGTVSAVSGSEVVESIGTPVVFESANSFDVSAAYDANAQKVVVAYRDNGNSNYGTAVVGTVSGTSISFGTPVVFESASSQYVSIAYDANAQKVVIAYMDGGNSNYGTAIVGTVSGTSISFGTPAVFKSAYSLYITIAYDANAQKVVIAWRDATNDDGTAIVGQTSGTSISFGTAAVYDSGNCNYNAAVYDANAQKVVIAYSDVTNSDKGEAVVATVSGTSISFGTPVLFEDAAISAISVVYDPDAQKVVIAYQDQGNSNYGTAIVGTVSGTSISFGTAVVFEGAATVSATSAAYDTTNDRVVIAYRDGNKGSAILGTVSGTSISFGTSVEIESGATPYIATVYDSNAQKTVSAYQDDGNSGYGTAVVYQVGEVNTNLTAENYIGISDAAYSSSATATIQIVGSVDDAQSGLTAGQKYYVQADGSLGETPITPSVFAGTAVSATKIIVKG
tara:strand:+ start:14 stop:1855 length:1842 start_codon:yes stop_codon:yes gene_type:complete